MAQKKKHYRVTIYNMNCGLGKNGKPTETEEVTVCARNQAEAERLAVSGGPVSRENGWGAWDSVEVDEKGHQGTPGKAKAKKTAAKPTKKTASKLTGKVREEQSAELFTDMREYNLLGFRIGDGLRNMFDTLVTSISKNKMGVLPNYRYVVSPDTNSASFRFVIKSGTRTYTVYTSIDREDPKNASLGLTGATKTQFPFSEKGVRDMLKEIKAAK